MTPIDTLPPVPAGDENAADDVWPATGPAKGLRVRLPIAVACLAVVAFAGAAAGAALKKPAAATTVQSGAVRGNRGAGANGANGANGAAGVNGTGGRFGGPGGGVFGTVTKVEGNTVTVTQRDGTTATVEIPSGTTIDKTVSGSLADLKSGTSIAVRGTTADGKTTAQSITINPANGLPGGFGGRTQSGSPTGS